MVADIKVVSLSRSFHISFDILKEIKVHVGCAM